MTKAPLVSTESSISTQLPLGSEEEDEEELLLKIPRASSNKFELLPSIVANFKL